MRRALVTTALIGVLLASAGWAQDDGPGRGVARISLINGDVSVRRGDSGDHVAAAVNGPLVVEDRVITGPGSRAEVQLDWAHMLRLASNTEVRFSELEQRRYQVQVAAGTVTLSVLGDTDAEMELNTPSVSVRPAEKGVYRVTVLDNGETEVTVRSGEAEVFTPQGVERVRSGRTLLARGSADDPEFRIVSAANRDEWDRWNESRDRELRRSGSYKYVSRDIYGAYDLDRYGRWVYAPPYGWVWSPSGVAYDWAPYRHGRWAWVDWYGWTWVSYDPWGWAPYHYGRWFHHRPYGWCWYPGSIHARHYWRPALVAFFGFGHGGAHFDIGIGFGRVGWVPLAPYEPYYPWYGHGHYRGYRNRTYVDNSVRIVNNVNVTNVYRNARVTHGVSGLDAQDFVRGGRGRSIRLSDPDYRNASLMRGPVPITPGRDSLRMSDRPVRTANLPRTVERERFFSRRQPAAVERVSFQQQQEGMQRMVRGTFNRGEAGSVRAGGPDRTEAGRPTRTDAGRNTGRNEAAGSAERSRGGWRQATQTPDRAAEGRTTRTEAAREGRTGSTPAGDGWRRFGDRRATETGAERGSQTGAASERWRRSGEPASRGGASRDVPAANRAEAGERAPRSEAAREIPSVNRDRSADRPAENWRRFGDNRTEGGGPRMENRERGETTVRQPSGSQERFERRSDPFGGDRGGAARQERSAPRPQSERFTAPRQERSQPIFINPPIIRERGGARMDSSPRREMPRMTSPRSDGGGGRISPQSRGGGESRGGGRMESRGGGGRRRGR